jgi:protein-arginine kinase activator protein McsA
MKIKSHTVQKRFGCAKCLDIPEQQIVAMWRYIQHGKCKKCDGEIVVLKEVELKVIFEQSEFCE